MKLYSIPPAIRGIIFDIDGTLYTNEDYVRSQTEVQIAHLARLRNVSYEQQLGEIRERQAELAAAAGGAKTSLGNVFASLGIPIETSVAWRERLLEPERFLSPDDALRAAIIELSRRYRVAIVTNNPIAVAIRTLAALGVADLFTVIVGLDSTWISKPAPEPFQTAAEALGLPPAALVSVGDRFDVDLSVPLKLGMGGILVDGVEDVYLIATALGHRGLRSRYNNKCCAAMVLQLPVGAMIR